MKPFFEKIKSWSSMKKNNASPLDADNNRKKIKGLRWYIAGLLCLASGLNYLDRNTLSILAKTIQTDLNLTDGDYANITSAFLVSYTIMYALSGLAIDRLGTRRSFLLFVSGWSAANVLHAFGRTALQFSFFRFFLGAAEAGNFPAGVKTVSEWFPMRERALAIGIFNSGTAIGAALAAPIIAYITIYFGWRSAFVAGGLLGFVWLILWQLIYRLPKDHPRLSATEYAFIKSDHALGDEEVQRKISLIRLLQTKECWACIFARILTDPISYFFIFWTPKFLQEERGFSLADIGKYGWIPYAAAAIGNLTGGVIPNRLTSIGWSLDKARKSAMLTASLMMPVCCLMIIFSTSPWLAVAAISLALFFNGVWANITLPAELFPQSVVATVSGLSGMMGGVAGIITQQITGRIVQTLSYAPIFWAAGCCHLIGFALVLLLAKELGKIRAFS